MSSKKKGKDRKKTKSDPNDDGDDACTVVPNLNTRPKTCDYSPPKKPDPWGGWNKGKTSAEEEVNDNNKYFLFDSTMSRVPNPISTERAQTLMDQQPQVPEEWDWRSVPGLEEQFKGSLINQGACGACWAVATATALGDRYAIALQKMGWTLKKPIQPSVVQLASCNCKLMAGAKTSDICKGGNVQLALIGLSDTEAPYLTLTTDKCWPYPQTWLTNPKNIKNATGPNLTWQPDKTGDGTLGCMMDVQGCQIGQQCPEADVKLNCVGDVHTWHVGIPDNANVENLKRDIFMDGPVPTSFQVLPSFMDTKTNRGWWTDGDPNSVYYPSEKGDALTKASGKGHAVVIVGWTKNAWIVRNSWGPSHGSMFGSGGAKIMGSWYFLADINNQIGIGVGPNPAMAGAVSFKPRFYDLSAATAGEGPLEKQGYITWDKNTPKNEKPYNQSVTPRPANPVPTTAVVMLPTRTHILWAVLIIASVVTVAIAIISTRKKPRRRR